MSSAIKATSIFFEIKCKVTKGPHRGQVFTFSKSPITIGRGPDNDITLAGDPMVSRNHVKIVISDGDVEVINLSQKNSLVIEGDSVLNWKLLNGSFFNIGDSEITVEIDLGAKVISTPAVSLVSKKSNFDFQINESAEKTNISIKIDPVNSVEKKDPQPISNWPTEKQSNIAQTEKIIKNVQKVQKHPAQLTHEFNQPYNARQVRASKDPALPFYIIIGLVVLAVVFLVLDPGKKSSTKAQNKKTLLKYEDEVTMILDSKAEKEKDAELKKKYDQKNSALSLRAQENFIRGMREFQLGQFARAEEFFQTVLNLQPSYELARKYLNLSRTRFDEVLNAKLMLGESNYQKHNFRMCLSQFRQAMNMLEGRNQVQKYQLAESMAQKCDYALQGIK